MKNNFVAMGCFYRANPYGLVKTICRVFFMLENEFKNIFLS